ncbi:MAG: sugar transferase [Clostridia bacterium]|nr:sugar transferase [Clostridia bacterium]MBQ7043542.1 sugar transferase [Clostridia bacterium]
MEQTALNGGARVKRIFDFVASLFAVILLSPLFLVVSILILVTDGSPVLFRQERVGKDNKIFTVYKFRTMRNGTGDIATSELSDADEKITKTGRFLRMTSIDELPQLFNILNGTMSIVGPRPLIPAEKEIRELREQYGVYSVLPGITGYAQINGRDNIDDKTKALLDKEYVEKQSFKFDMEIIFKTFIKVIKRSDIKDTEEL